MEKMECLAMIFAGENGNRLGALTNDIVKPVRMLESNDVDIDDLIFGDDDHPHVSGR